MQVITEIESPHIMGDPEKPLMWKEGGDHPDRDAQYKHINAVAKEFLAAGDPIISVDCKKKELIGEYKNPGRELTHM